MTKEKAIRIDKESFGSYDEYLKLKSQGLNPHCTCLFCGAEFGAKQIKKVNIFHDAGGKKTILCPYCDVDAVVIDHCFTKTAKRQLFKYLFEEPAEPLEKDTIHE